MDHLWAFRYKEDSSLSHHGIEGQKWGVRNGPPYPLESKQFSKSEKQAKNNRSDSKDLKKMSLSDNELEKMVTKIASKIFGDHPSKLQKFIIATALLESMTIRYHY